MVEAGTVPDGVALGWQQDLHRRRVAGRIPDLVLLLEHPHVYTLGRRFAADHLLVDRETLRRRGIEVHEADRGGSITYHGPGQLVGYPIVALQDPARAPEDGRGPDAVTYLRDLEEVIIRTVAGFGVIAQRREGLTGVWVGDPGREEKLASIGVNVSRGVTKHGFALNVTTDLSYFAGMVPCGIAEVRVTSLDRLLGQAPDMEAVRHAVVVHLAVILGARVRSSSLAQLGLAAPGGEPEGAAAVGLLRVTMREEAKILPFPGKSPVPAGSVPGSGERD